MTDTDKISLWAELVRKTIHLTALAIPISYYFMPFTVAFAIVAVLAVVSIVADSMRLANLWPWRMLVKIIPLDALIRKHERRGGFTGASYVMASAAITMLLFPKIIAITAMLYIILGDATAAIVGRTFGRHPLLHDRTIEGSIACLIVLAAVAFAVPGLPLTAGLIGALVATLTEAFSWRIDDNATVPLTSGFVMLLIMSIMGYNDAVLFGGIKGM